MEKCTKCGEEKPTEDFYVVKHKRMLHCKKCVRSHQANWKHAKYPLNEITVKRRELKEKGLKRCKECSETKPLEEFHKRGRGGTRSACKECHGGRFRAPLRMSKRQALRRGHESCTATEGEIEAAFTGFCFVCGVPEIECSKRLCMDHCHQTGRFRGWLCEGCNAAAGYLKDSPQIARILAEYIEQSQKNRSLIKKEKS